MEQLVRLPVVHILPVTNANNLDHQRRRGNGVDDPVISFSNAVSVLRTNQLPYSDPIWIRRQLLNCPNNSLDCIFGKGRNSFTADRFQTTLYGVITTQLSENFVMRDSRLCTPLSHSRKILQVFQQFLKFADGQNDGGLLACLVRYILEIVLFHVCHSHLFARALQAGPEGSRTLRFRCCERAAPNLIFSTVA